MNCLVIFAVLATAVSIQGAIIPGDTPQLALAKAAHFAEAAKEPALVAAPLSVAYRSVAYPVDTIAAARFAPLTEHARAAATADSVIAAGVGFPYADYYKSLSDFYTSSAARNAYAPEYISAARVIAPGAFFIP